MKKCSFTGHRVIADECLEKLSDLLGRAVEYAYSSGCRSFYTGGAVGFDTMAARAVLAYRMSHRDLKLIIAVPCKNQDAKWTEAEKDAYAYILSNADEVVFISEEYTKDCMKRRNEYLASVCDILIAYSGRSASGSAQTVRMAKTLGKEVYNLYSHVASAE